MCTCIALRHICLLAILIEMVYLYAWASGATAKFVGMPRKLKFYQKKSAERLKKLRKLIVDNYVMRNADSSPSRCRFLSLYTDIISMVQTAVLIKRVNNTDNHAGNARFISRLRSL